MGMHKPWAPSRSYGLVVRLDAGLQPLASLHSRAERRAPRRPARRRGTTAGSVVAAKGGDCLIAVDIAPQARH